MLVWLADVFVVIVDALVSGIPVVRAVVEDVTFPVLGELPGVVRASVDKGNA